MNAADADHLLFDDTLASDDEFPASIRLARSARECGDAARRAEITLRAMAAIEESHEESEGHSAGEHVSARIEAKVDLAIGLLAMIAAHHGVIPATVEVHWSRRGMRLRHPDALAEGALVICSAHLLPTLPMPVDVPLEVIACEAAAEGFTLWCKVPESAFGVQAGIERELFRRHRRLIAERRATR